MVRSWIEFDGFEYPIIKIEGKKRLIMSVPLMKNIPFVTSIFGLMPLKDLA